MHFFLGPRELPFCLICATPPRFARGGMGRSDGSSSSLPLPSCPISAVTQPQWQCWAGEGGEQPDRWMSGFATCPGTWLVLGPRVGSAATQRCNFAAFYLKTALSQEKWELLGMTVASGNPGEDRVEGKNHRQGPELGRIWSGTAAPSVTGRLRPPPS